MKNSSLKWGLGAVVFIGVLYALFIYLPAQLTPSSNSALFDTSKDWAIGPANAKLTLIEYSDFQCPACAQYYPLVKQLEAAFPNDLKVVYRQFPLRQIHANADLAARATEATGSVGKFWEMHDKIFETQKDWSTSENATDIFAGYAEALGMNKEDFVTALNSAEVAKAVAADEATGKSLAVQGTPTFFLNGKKLENPRSFDEFKKVIETELNKEQESI